MPIFKRPVRDYMTPLPQTIGAHESIGLAAERMRQLGARHLPVVENGELTGVVSERDIGFLQSLPAELPPDIRVKQLMTPEPYTVGPEMPLGIVTRTMAERKLGSVLVVEGKRVVGILTTTDALGLLATFLANARGIPVRDHSPGSIRERIRDEHAVLRKILARANGFAKQVLAGDQDAEPALNAKARELYQSLLRHIELEDTLLAPALRESDAFGPVRAEKLVEGHENQRKELQEALAAIDLGTARDLAESVQRLTPLIEQDMEAEEKDLLSEKILRDDPINADIFSG